MRTLAREVCVCMPDCYLGDVYDGEVWKTFNSSEYKHFLKTPYSYLITMNVDWFQPFVHTVYSTGAIYLTIQNLPRHEQYKHENVILVGLIPGPKEPKLTANAYLTPLIIELKDFWEGVMIPVKISNTVHIRTRLALSCVACDIPASRKVCGFLGISARLGCNKCLKEFPSEKHGNGQKTNYSGFDHNSWQLRSNSSHRDECTMLYSRSFTTKSALHTADANAGVRYSVLLDLPYFDPVKFTVIDPMHNLYLGTAKHVFELWIEKELLTNANLLQIEARAKLFRLPADIGRLPSNVSSGYSGFTANQWCNWITIYSPVLLKGILPNLHLCCWLLFVRACSILRNRIITENDITAADLFSVHI